MTPDCRVVFNHCVADVVGYVTDVGPQSVKATGARTVEFNLTNERKRGVRVTLWGQLGDAMLKKKEQNPAVYSIILTSMSAKFHLGTALLVCLAQPQL
ncbi:putative nucleic acid-binding protein [Helianthus annuus]|nr:putative nucleic acid-binding protein [Helianthus annuus]